MTPVVPAGLVELVVWPVVAVVGFLVLAGLVVVLGRSSTARYEFERNAVRSPAGARSGAGPAAGAGRPAPTGPAGPAGGAGPAAAAAAGDAARTDGGGQALPAGRTAVGVAAHPAGRRVAGTEGATAWWLVDGSEDRPGLYAVAGPFPARTDALCAALAADLDGSARALHGTLRADGTVLRRVSAQDSAWLAHLGEQLDRLPEEWDADLDDDDPMVTLLVEVTAALAESGLPLWDATGPRGALGGVCLAVEPGLGGVVAGWRQHDRMSVDQVHGADADVDVQQVLNAALLDLLRVRGFVVHPLGGAASGCVVYCLA
ncbi:hypothetical protein SAMN05660690_0737 [Geodermatophilus telluris]|uniref:Uncharacterized protein n=1 Tax=Geodermatophilus telluris TaxID=1190417 RepID=A0A1G6JCV2_9ACTN|nr:hypothetical protein [Geodermatophilus telluris]SDC15736.1 hypothetical protein SAMN05660690_0737 [Geodermatophilus telluris]